MSLDPTLPADPSMDMPMGDGQGMDGMPGTLDNPSLEDMLGDAMGAGMVSDGDDTGLIAGVEPENLPNYVLDQEVMDKVKDILQTCKLARDNRQSKVEQDWLRYRDIYNCRRNLAYYEGRSKLFIPAVKKAVDTLVRIAKDAIMSDPYLGIETDIPKYHDVAMDLMKWLLEDQGKFREKLPMFLRQLYIIGTSCLKFSWEKQKKLIKYREFDKTVGQSIIKEREQFVRYGPKFEVIDMRHVYAWPETEVDYEGLRLVFEDSTITKDELLDGVEAGLFDAVITLKAMDRKSASLETQRLSESQASQEGMGDASKLPKDVVDITYCWAKFRLPGQQSDHWNQIIFLNDNLEDVIRVAENPWWFQTPNYLFGKLFQEHDYFYGHGVVELTEMWQYMVNDMANQVMDSGTFTINPIVAYDPAAIDDPDQLEVQPMAKWPIPPDNVEMIRPPIELATTGFQFIQLLMNIIQESSDATAIIQGTPRTGVGPTAGTATGVTQLANAASSAVIDQVDALEDQVLTPLAKNVEIMAHEFMDEEMIIRKVGQDGVVLTQRVIKPEDLILSKDLRWIASNRLREKAAKIQQLMNFFNLAIKTPPQLTMQQGFQISFKEIVKDIYSGLGLPNIDRVIIDTTSAVPGIPPEFENELLDAGRAVVASPLDLPQNHQAHLQAHMLHKPKSDIARVRMMEHIASHYQALQQSMMQAQAMANAGGQAAGKGAPGTAQQGPGGERPQEMAQSEDGSDTVAGVLNQLGLG